MSATVRYYPVINGDSTLLELTSGKQILVDCRFINNDPPYDVHKDLLEKVKKKDSRPYLPCFLLTHGDEDHCLGYANVFHTGELSTYKQPKTDEKPKIVVGTMWFSPHIFQDDELCKDAKEYRKEAQRRMDLHRRRAPERNQDGNRIVVVGYSSDPVIQGLPDDITYRAGDIIDIIDGEQQSDFRLFIHAPFRRNLDDENVVRNDTSISFMAAFGSGAVNDATTFFFGGDANYAVLEEILRQSKLHGNEEWLSYDAFMGPHHCSWGTFNETPYAENTTPREKILELLDYKRSGARIVVSCKPISSSDSNPPHHAAKKEYVKKVGSDKFYCTMEYPNKTAPQPIVFEIGASGPSLKRNTSAAAVVIGSARQQRSKPEYGSC